MELRFDSLVVFVVGTADARQEMCCSNMCSSEVCAQSICQTEGVSVAASYNLLSRHVDCIMCSDMQSFGRVRLELDGSH